MKYFVHFQLKGPYQGQWQVRIDMSVYPQYKKGYTTLLSNEKSEQEAIEMCNLMNKKEGFL